MPPKVIQPGPISMSRLPSGMPNTGMPRFLTLLKRAAISGDWITAPSIKASDLVKGLFHHPINENRYKQLKTLQAQTGFSVAQIALGYLLGQPFPVYPIIGPKKVADLDESLSAAEVALSPKQVDFLTADP